MEPGPLTGRVAIVTVASAGIGEAIAITLAEAGHRSSWLPAGSIGYKPR
ncbi:MAG: hypothetical protein O2992_07780 [Gemmatimonadetes bacterium]|nr:hypothetical protein [Gemmatimonadota bacterium]